MVKKSKTIVQRKSHNEDLIYRMKNGESLQNQTAVESWFPPRPVIKKNTGAMKSLYGDEPFPEILASENDDLEKKPRHLKLA